MANVFWNYSDRRLRAFWRLLLHIFLLAATGLVAIALAGLSPAVSRQLAMDDSGMISQANPTSELIAVFLSALAIVAATLFAARFLDHRPISDLGLRFTPRWRRDLGFGLLLGALLMLFVFLAELALGWITIEGTFSTDLPYSFGVAMLRPLTLFLLVGIYEELLSRGYQLKNLAEGLSFAPLGPKGGILLALLLSSAIFGLLHGGNANATTVSTFNIFLAGLFLGLPVLLTDELAMSIGIHITWNFFQGNVFGFPVSGAAVNRTTFIAVAQGGPELWTGGAFGPEAGLLGITAMIIGSLLIIWWVKGTRGTARIKFSLAEYQPPFPAAPGPATRRN